MEVIVLTTLFSVLFAAFFLLLFLRFRGKGSGCSDSDALLPFETEDSLTNPLRPCQSDFPEKSTTTTADISATHFDDNHP